jgi:DNA polymerase-2
VTSRLDLVFDRLYLKLFLPAMRTAHGGARKRYVGLQGRRDRSRSPAWRPCAATGTALAREVQRALYARLFADEPVEPYLRGRGGGLRAGPARTTGLVYRKAPARRDAASYTATTPLTSPPRARWTAHARAHRLLITTARA